jgi:hypothetical protein
MAVVAAIHKFEDNGTQASCQLSVSVQSRSKQESVNLDSPE